MGVFCLAKVARGKQLLQTDNLGTLRGRFADAQHSALHVIYGLLTRLHLNQANGHRAGWMRRDDGIISLSS
jgi:hypothetical protein